MTSGDQLTGALLVAHPALRDPNFRRTIIFLSQHSPQDGAMGFVLNRPMESLSTSPVYYGGPVDSDKMILTSLQWRDNPTLVAFRAFPDPDDAAALSGWEAGLRIFVGHSGWAPGQLENEIAANTWLILPPTRPLIEMASPETAWKNIMRLSSPLLHLLSEAPDDPTKN
jgi:putative transcriptional regulator